MHTANLMAAILHENCGRDGRGISIRRMVIVFLILAFLFGGSSRADVFALSILRPAVLVLLALIAFGLGESQRRHVEGIDWPLWMLATWISVAVAQLIVLPVSLWQKLHGGGGGPIAKLILDVSRADWLPYSMAPANTLNVVMALAVPLTAMMLARRLDTDGHRTVAGTLGMLAMLSGVLGLLQMATQSQFLYLYQQVTLGDAAGVFANRNHQAVFLPVASIAATAWAMTSPLVARQHAKVLIGCGIVGLLVYGGILTLIGSRQGLLLGMVALLPITLMVQQYVPRRVFVLSTLGALSASAIAITLLTFSDRITALSRLGGHAAVASKDVRWTMLPTNLEILQTAWPFGVGFGAFPKIVEIFEPDTVLRLTHLNHAHNDPLEFLIDGGFVSAALMGSFVTWWLCASWQVWKPAKSWSMRVFGQAGSTMLMVLILASFVDYPVRTPLLASVAALSMVWLEIGRHRHAGSSRCINCGDVAAQ